MYVPTLEKAQLFSVQIADDHFQDIIEFFTTGLAPAEYTTQQKKHLVFKAEDFTLIAGQLYKLGPDEVLRRCVLIPVPCVYQFCILSNCFLVFAYDK